MPSWLLKVIAYVLPAVAGWLASAAQGSGTNPFPVGTIMHNIWVPLAGFVATVISLIVHPNGVNGPAALVNAKSNVPQDTVIRKPG